jgi:hypothetical protein
MERGHHVQKEPCRRQDVSEDGGTNAGERDDLRFEGF